MEKIGVFGGTFNPPHKGHTRAASMFASRLGLDRLIVVPLRFPPHRRDDGSVAPEQRLAMARLAFADMPCPVEVSDIEIRRDAVSYTVDTMEAVSAANPGAELWFLMGSDQFIAIETWRRFEDLFKICGMAVIPRHAGEIPALTRQAAELKAKYAARSVVLECDALDVSSSMLRSHIARGQGYEGLEPFLERSVYEYIVEQGLYREAWRIYNPGGLRWDQIGELRKEIALYMGAERYAHTLGVEGEAARLAGIYLPPEDEVKARAAALLHDITKELGKEAQLELCRRFGIDPDAGMGIGNWFHAVTAAEVARHMYGAQPEVCSAIRNHTMGEAGMTTLDKIIYLSDYIEPGNTYDACVKIRHRFGEMLAATGDENGCAAALDEAILDAARHTLSQRQAKGLPIHPNTVRLKEWLESPGQLR